MIKKLLITGGSGFIGTHIIKALGNGFEIYNLSPSHVEGTIHLKIEKNELFNFDTININFDYIIHTLALSNEKYCSDFENAEKINIVFTKDLIYFAKKQNSIKKFVFLSTIILYDSNNLPPVNENSSLNVLTGNYSFTKGIAEKYVHFLGEQLGIPTIIFRVANIYGPGQTYINSPLLIPSKIYEGLEKNKIVVYNLSPMRDWLYIDDAIDAIVKSLSSEHTGIYNLGSGTGYSVKEILDFISSHLGIEYSSLDLPVTGPMKFYADISKIQKDLNWTPKINLNEGLKNTILSIKEKYEHSNN